jgi:hypothetical protein
MFSDPSGMNPVGSFLSWVCGRSCATFGRNLLPDQWRQDYDASTRGDKVAGVVAGAVFVAVAGCVVGGCAALAAWGAAGGTACTQTELCQDIQDTLMPGGQPLGSPGSSDIVRIVEGGEAEAQGLFDSLAQGAQQLQDTSYPGTLMKISDESFVGLRFVASNSPGTLATIDVNIPNIPIEEIKFNG